MALSDCTKEAITSVNYELIGKFDCIKIFNDNQSAQKLSANQWWLDFDVFHDRLKHIDIRYHFIREVVSNNAIELNYLYMYNDMTADILTKSLKIDKHNKIVNDLGSKS